MTPNYLKAATKAAQLIVEYRINPADINPLSVLKKLPNVLLISFAATDKAIAAQSYNEYLMLERNDFAFTLVNKKAGNLQFIVIYNADMPQPQLRLALARELGHIVLEHDGSDNDLVWQEEASCFAHHFLCPAIVVRPRKAKEKTPKIIHYRPKMDSTLWELKSIQPFSSIEEMATFIADERNMINRNREKYAPVTAKDVLLRKINDSSDIAGWSNCFDVVLNGVTVGYCGE